MYIYMQICIDMDICHVTVICYSSLQEGLLFIFGSLCGISCQLNTSFTCRVCLCLCAPCCWSQGTVFLLNLPSPPHSMAPGHILVHFLLSLCVWSLRSALALGGECCRSNGRPAASPTHPSHLFMELMKFWRSCALKPVFDSGPDLLSWTSQFSSQALKQLGRELVAAGSSSEHCTGVSCPCCCPWPSECSHFPTSHLSEPPPMHGGVVFVWAVLLGCWKPSKRPQEILNGINEHSCCPLGWEHQAG